MNQTGCSAVGSAPALGAGCRGFESLHSDQKSKGGAAGAALVFFTGKGFEGRAAQSKCPVDTCDRERPRRPLRSVPANSRQALLRWIALNGVFKLDRRQPACVFILVQHNLSCNQMPILRRNRTRRANRIPSLRPKRKSCRASGRVFALYCSFFNFQFSVFIKDRQDFLNEY